MPKVSKKADRINGLHEVIDLTKEVVDLTKDIQVSLEKICRDSLKNILDFISFHYLGVRDLTSRI